MDLDLDISPRTRGRPARPVEYEIVREINEADLALLEAAPRGVTPTSLKRLRDAHHGIARLIATGAPQHEIAAITGYSQSRISILKSDPAFQELVEHYRKIALDAAAEITADRAVKMAALHDLIVEEKLTRLEESPESIDHETLDKWDRTAADRTGMGPQTKSMNVNLNVGIADQLAARSRRTSLPGASAKASLPSGEAAAAVRLPPPSETAGEARRAEPVE